MTNLSSDQVAAIRYDNSSVILAGPGSGKTLVLTHKIANQLEKTAEYQGIVAISYTNKASDELKSRVKSKILDTKQSFFGTIDRFYITEIVLPFTKYILDIRCRLPDIKFEV